MNRTRALTLTFVVTMLLASVACGALLSLQVSPTLIALICMLIVGAGSHLASRIVMHYGVSD